MKFIVEGAGGGTHKESPQEPTAHLLLSRHLLMFTGFRDFTERIWQSCYSYGLLQPKD